MHSSKNSRHSALLAQQRSLASSSSSENHREEEREEKPSKWRDISLCVSALFFPGVIAALLSLTVDQGRSIATNATEIAVAEASAKRQEVSAKQTLPTEDKQPASSSSTAKATPEGEALADPIREILEGETDAERVAREQRYRQIELQLAAAAEAEAKQARYELATAGAITLDTPKGAVVYAFGNQGDNVSVNCELSEFGSIAILSSNVSPEVFYKARFLDGCTQGTYSPGEAVGSTLGELSWSEHNQTTGSAQEPSAIAIEWALTGYSGQYAAPATDSQIALKENLEKTENAVRGLLDRL